MSEGIFLSTVLAVACAWVVGLFAAGDSQERGALRWRWAIGGGLGLGLWLLLTGWFAAQGTLANYRVFPAPMIILMGASGVFTLLLAFSPLGGRLAFGLPIVGLVGFQAFRIAVELVLALLYHEGRVPRQMTIEGANMDLYSGLFALLAAGFAARNSLPRWALLLWNSLSFGLLLNIVVISILSSPVPFRVFWNEPANTIIATFPFVWLPVFLVQAAFFGHILIVRRIWREHHATEAQTLPMESVKP